MTTKGKMTKADRERLESLAAFAPIFRNPQFAFGKWHYPTGEGPLFMAWFEKSEAANQFLVVAHEIVETLKRKGFDWTKWIEQPEGQRLFFWQHRHNSVGQRRATGEAGVRLGSRRPLLRR